MTKRSKILVGLAQVLANHTNLVFESLRIEVVFFRDLVKIAHIDSREFRGFADMAAHGAQASDHEIPLRLFSGVAFGFRQAGELRRAGRSRGFRRHAGGKMTRLDAVVLGQQHGTLQNILQFAHVAGIIIRHEQPLRVP